jgi:hypothetical protein
MVPPLWSVSAPMGVQLAARVFHAQHAAVLHRHRFPIQAVAHICRDAQKRRGTIHINGVAHGSSGTHQQAPFFHSGCSGVGIGRAQFHRACTKFGKPVHHTSTPVGERSGDQQVRGGRGCDIGNIESAADASHIIKAQPRTDRGCCVTGDRDGIGTPWIDRRQREISITVGSPASLQGAAVFEGEGADGVEVAG